MWKDDREGIRNSKRCGMCFAFPFTLFFLCVLEFTLEEQVKKEWAKLLLRMKQFDVYVSMRARIALRKA
jgi:hypothetical protein